MRQVMPLAFIVFLVIAFTGAVLILKNGMAIGGAGLITADEFVF